MNPFIVFRKMVRPVIIEARFWIGVGWFWMVMGLCLILGLIYLARYKLSNMLRND